MKGKLFVILAMLCVVALLVELPTFADVNGDVQEGTAGKQEDG